MKTLSMVPEMAQRRMRLSLDGLSVGDAFGERFFLPPEQFETLVHGRALPRPPWRYTDDTEMALALVETLEAKGRVDQDALANAFGRRYRRHPDRGYAGTARQILEQVSFDHVPWKTASSAPYGGTGSMGNGSAMRVAPLGAFFGPDYPRVVEEARKSAQVTHWHPEGQAGAIAIAVAAAWATGWTEQKGRADALFECVLEFTPRGSVREGIAAARLFTPDCTPQDAAKTLGSGQRVICADTVPFCVWAIARHLGAYEEALWTTVAGKGDRDTTCAIVGGVVALTDPAGIPAGWLAAREPLEGAPG